MANAKTLANCLQQDRSRKNIGRLVDELIREEFDLLAFLSEIDDFPQPTRWRLSWWLTHFVEAQPDIGEQGIQKLWENVKATEHNGMLRDYWRSLTFVEIPEALSAEIFDRAQQVIMSERFAIAVRAHAMYVAMNIARPYPELLDELELVFAPIQSEGSSTGLRARAKNLRKEIAKLKKKR